MIYRKEKTSKFSVIDNKYLYNPNLSLKAKGLLTIVLSFPDKTKFTIGKIEKLTQDKAKSISSALNELIKYGYAKKYKAYPGKTKSGRIEYRYNFYECGKPVENLWNSCGISVEFKNTESPTTENFDKSDLQRKNKTPDKTTRPKQGVVFGSLFSQNTDQGLSNKTPDKTTRPKQGVVFGSLNGIKNTKSNTDSSKSVNTNNINKYYQPITTISTRTMGKISEGGVGGKNEPTLQEFKIFINSLKEKNQLFLDPNDFWEEMKTNEWAIKTKNGEWQDVKNWEKLFLTRNTISKKKYIEQKKEEEKYKKEKMKKLNEQLQAREQGYYT